MSIPTHEQETSADFWRAQYRTKLEECNRWADTWREAMREGDALKAKLSVALRSAEEAGKIREDVELLQRLRDSFMLEEEPGKGTEGRSAWHLWCLPFGRSTNNQFGEIIKYGVAIFRNSYDDFPLSFFRAALAPKETR